MKYIGIDGCKIGWFYTAINRENEWETGVSENIEILLETHSDFSLLKFSLSSDRFDLLTKITQSVAHAGHAVFM
jgi:predicted RNase H-like nuclease